MRLSMTTLASALLISACATTGPDNYGPANGSNFGYSETKLETARYRVSYQGSGRSNPDQVEQLALRRAAELTLENSYDWFRLVDRLVEGEERGGVSVGGGVGSGRFGRRSSVGVGVGGNFGTVGAKEFYTVRLEVLMGNNPKPDEPDFYDARSVLDNTGTAPSTGTASQDGSSD